MSDSIGATMSRMAVMRMRPSLGLRRRLEDARPCRAWCQGETGLLDAICEWMRWRFVDANSTATGKAIGCEYGPSPVGRGCRPRIGVRGKLRRWMRAESAPNRARQQGRAPHPERALP